MPTNPRHPQAAESEKEVVVFYFLKIDSGFVGMGMVVGIAHPTGHLGMLKLIR